jgi:archaellum component FlaC
MSEVEELRQRIEDLEQDLEEATVGARMVMADALAQLEARDDIAKIEVVYERVGALGHVHIIATLKTKAEPIGIEIDIGEVDDG